MGFSSIVVTETGGKVFRLWKFSSSNQMSWAFLFILFHISTMPSDPTTKPTVEVQDPIMAKPSVLLQPMLIPRTVGALLFDGKYVRKFILIIEWHGAIAGLVSNQLPAYVLQYCSTEVKKVICWSEELDGTDWDAVKELLIGLYSSSDKLIPVTIDDLQDFIKETRSCHEFMRWVDIDWYHQGFLAIAGQLKKKGEL